MQDLDLNNRAPHDPRLLDATLAAAKRDGQTVSSGGNVPGALLPGALERDLTVHTDARGSVFEMFDTRWNWHPDPVEFIYCFTIRPGIVKGWALHKEHEDRYILLQGEMELVLYDVRPDSPTCGEIRILHLTEQNRRIVSIPRLVWHADRNIGSKDVIGVNLPTRPYDHANPDKYRLPVNTDLIPHSFGNAQGW
jgi:dTDP-4-dehydrorhamnose 3,5-epimerase